MAWVAAYAGWSTLLGLVVATATGRELKAGDAPDVSLGTSTLFTVLLPLVPTLVALWFNDWARDGFPTKAERRRAERAAPPESVPPAAQVAPESAVAEDRPAARFPVAPIIRDE